MRKHPSSLSFVTQSVPAEAPLTDREAFLAAHPQAKAVQTAIIAEFHEKFTTLLDGLNPLLQGFVAKAETARQIGIVLLELAESLPGKKLTRDFYEQMKPQFQDAQGRQVSLELLEWFMATARKNVAPIEDMATALKYVQPLLLASGEPEFQLLAEPIVKQRIPPQDEFGKLTSWWENPDLADNWEKFKSNDKYWPGGHLRPDIKATLAEEVRPVIKVLDELRRELGI